VVVSVELILLCIANRKKNISNGLNGKKEKWIEIFKKKGKKRIAAKLKNEIIAYN
jgi:hypothetical protein